MTEVFKQKLQGGVSDFPQNCFFCGDIIESFFEARYLPIKLNKQVKDGKKTKVEVQEYLRCVHDHCYPVCLDKMIESKQIYKEKKKKEIDYRDKAYRKIKDLVGLNKFVPSTIDKYIIARLDGMKQGRKFSKGQNVYLVERGVSFELIWITFVMCESEIVKLLSSGSMKDDKHRINSILYIIENNLSNVSKQLSTRKAEERQLDSFIQKLADSGEIESEFDYEKIRVKPSQAVLDILSSFDEDDGEEDLTLLLK